MNDSERLRAIFDGISGIREEYIEETVQIPRRVNNRRFRWGVVAALVVLMIGAVVWVTSDPDQNAQPLFAIRAMAEEMGDYDTEVSDGLYGYFPNGDPIGWEDVIDPDFDLDIYTSSSLDIYFKPEDRRPPEIYMNPWDGEDTFTVFLDYAGEPDDLYKFSLAVIDGRTGEEYTFSFDDHYIKQIEDERMKLYIAVDTYYQCCRYAIQGILVDVGNTELTIKIMNEEKEVVEQGEVHVRYDGVKYYVSTMW